MAETEMTDVEDVKAAFLDKVEELIETDTQDAIRKLREFLKGRNASEELDTYQERAVYELMKAYALIKDADALIGMLKELRNSFDSFSKSKRENIVKNVFDRLASIPNTDAKQIAICEEYIEYFRQEKRTFLRQRFETKLAALLTKPGDFQNFQKALTLLHSLSTEVKKLDDKLLLVEIYLIESRAHYSLNNVIKAKSSLTAGRTNATSVYVGVAMQAEIDIQAGILNAHDKDYRTAYSYFLEAHEGFNNVQNKSEALRALHYMILAKIMGGHVNEIAGILNFKNSLQFLSDPIVKLLEKISKCVKNRSLKEFGILLNENAALVNGDPLLKLHLNELRSDLLEKNLCRIIEPYSRVEIERVAQLIEMPEEDVQSKLSQMILDKKFNGTLDQGTGQLIVYEEALKETTYQHSIELIDSMGHVVNNLIRRAKHLHAQ